MGKSRKSAVVDLPERLLQRNNGRVEVVQVIRCRRCARKERD